MFMFKRILSNLLFPVPLCLEILTLGLFLLWFTRRQRAGKIVVTLGTVLLLLLSNYALTDTLLMPLEEKYPALIDPKSNESIPRDNKTSGIMIVMLGGGHVSDPRLPVTDQLSGTALARIVEAIRLYKALPGSKLIVSGRGRTDPVPEAEVLAKVAAVMGVNPQDIILEPDSINTEDQARRLKPMVGKEKFILVTSASHMPRSMALFQKQGMNPLPAPAEHFLKGRDLAAGVIPFPSSGYLYKAERAFYEYLGLAWARISGKI